MRSRNNGLCENPVYGLVQGQDKNFWDPLLAQVRVSIPHNQEINRKGHYIQKSAEEYAEKLKQPKYSALEPTSDFVPIAVDTAETWGVEAKKFIK